MDETCTICDKPLQNETDKIVKVLTKGLKTLIKISKSKEDKKWRLWSELAYLSAHDSCRKRYLTSGSRPNVKKKVPEPLIPPASISKPRISKTPSSSKTEIVESRPSSPLPPSNEKSRKSKALSPSTSKTRTVEPSPPPSTSKSQISETPPSPSISKLRSSKPPPRLSLKKRIAESRPPPNKKSQMSRPRSRSNSEARNSESPTPPPSNKKLRMSRTRLPSNSKIRPLESSPPLPNKKLQASRIRSPSNSKTQTSESSPPPNKKSRTSRPRSPPNSKAQNSESSSPPLPNKKSRTSRTESSFSSKTRTSESPPPPTSKFRTSKSPPPPTSKFRTSKASSTSKSQKSKAPSEVSSKTRIKESSPLSSISNSPSPSSPATSDIVNDFNFSELCFLCGKLLDRAHKQVFSVRHDYLQHRILDIADRKDDEDAKEIINRIQGIPSLVQVKAAYHKKCYSTLITPPPKEPTISEAKINKEESFSKVCSFIEKSGKIEFRLPDLQEAMGENILSKKVLFKKLKEKYGPDIHVLQHRGRETIIYYKKCNISNICSDWVCDEDSLGDVEKKTILTVAAQILRKEIINYTYNHETYPAGSKFLDNVLADVPQLLITFLGDLLLGKKSNHNDYIKRDFMAHFVVSMLRQRSFISTLQLALSIYIYRKTGSKLIIDLLSKFGVCDSYYNVQTHEASTIMNPPKINVTDAFVQYVFDNVTDHNVSTPDGRETFHCLGGIAAYTPDSGAVYENGSKRCRKMPSASVLASQKHIQSIPCGTFNSNALETIKFATTNTLQSGNPPLLPASYSTYLWAKTMEIPHFPTWKGFLEVLSNDMTYSMSHVTCLPFIDLPPTNLTTLNTSLQYAVGETRKLNQKTCFVTYDQPLYIKARSIVAQSQNTELANVVVRLGGFHLLMSYLGAIGYIMDGSGLEDLWTVAYTAKSVKKMLMGFAFSRALRAHILSFTALGITICKSIHVTQVFKNFLNKLFTDWSENPPLLSDCNSEPLILNMTEELIRKMSILENNGPTAKLWIQYFHCVTVALQFVEAERLGNWQLHLESIERMLPLFHATGHFAYAKSAQIYLQDMTNLETTMDPVEYEKFTKGGYFTIRRTDKAWSGVWGDMTIEQTIKRFFGPDLKQGRSITPSIKARYLLAMPAAFNIMECLETYCGITSIASDQQIELSEKTEKDNNDIKNFVHWFNEHDPFKPRGTLTSLSNGVTAGLHVNCHMAIEHGLEAMASMIGKNVEDISVCTLHKVKTLSTSKNMTHINDDKFVASDSCLLFQRISATFNNDVGKTRNALAYELSQFPLSLFDEHGFMRKASKSDLYTLFTLSVPIQILSSGVTFVIDGGWLLQQIIWPLSKTYGEILNLYSTYIIQYFGLNSIVVFDGYNDEWIGIKSYERYRRKDKNFAPEIDISEDTTITLTQTQFFSNTANKFKFIKLLFGYLQRNNISAKIANEDADISIIRTALELNQRRNTLITVVGNDVDLFVLLIALTPSLDTLYFYKVETEKNVLYSTAEYRHLQTFILFAHAFAGCDTTSAIYNHEKESIISILEKNQDLQQSSSIFYQQNRTADELYFVAEKIILQIYNTSKHKVSSIHELRYSVFTTLMARPKKQLSLALLPPTDSALREHTKRVYYQIQSWLGYYLNAEEWGWKRTNRMMLPIMTLKAAAPADVLEKVFCSCTGDCNTSRCGCKKLGLPCVHMCKNCNGESCENPPQKRKRVEDDVESEDEDEILHSEENCSQEQDVCQYISGNVEENIELDMDHY